MDTQSVKTSTNVPTATQGTDAGKRIIGRKRGIVTDTLGLPLAVMVTAVSASDNTIGVQLLDQASTAHPAPAKTWVDAGFKKPCGGDLDDGSMQQCRPNRWVTGSGAAFAGGRCPPANAVRIHATARTA